MALFDPKARLWVKGRKNILAGLKKIIPADEKVIWIHCASLGEFEQGRPLIESIRKNYPRYRILLSFFSPSGYEVQKNYPGADWVIYMPLDGPRTAKKFLDIVRPSLVIFVKYEFWYYYLKKIRYRNIPLILVSAHFRENMAFFKWHGALQRKMLSRFDHLFVQDATSKDLLDNIGLATITTVSGDTRFDRVIAISDASANLPPVENFIANSPVLVAGSTWPEDESFLKNLFTRTGLKLIIAPHEISNKHLDELSALFPGSIRYSLIVDQPVKSKVLIIDNIGMLSQLYRYATFCYIGGGLNPQGVHNVLEAAVYGKLVFFGPYHEKYREAVGLVESGGAICIRDQSQFAGEIARLLDDKEEFSRRSKAAGEFVRSNGGATRKIVSFLQEKRLLTS